MGVCVRALDRARYGLLTKRVIEKVRLRALREYGNFALAYSATFQPGLDYFGSEEGFLAYKQVGSTAFVLSNPLAPIGGWEDLIRSFLSERSDVCFWHASRPVDEGKVILSLGLSPLYGIEDKEFSSNRLVSFSFRAVYRSRLFNKLIYPLQGFAAHKGAFCGSAEQTYCAFNRGLALAQLVKMPRACSLS